MVAPALRILVIDDDADVRLLHREVLSSIGVVTDVADAYQGLAALENDAYDAIVTDLYMPGASGLDFVELLRARGNNTPVIVVTAAGERALENRPAAELVSAVLAKPAPVANLVRAVCAVTSGGVVPRAEVDIERQPHVIALRRQSAIAANLSEGVALIRAADGVILYTNAAFDGLFGYERGDLQGKPVSALNAPSATSTPEETAAAVEASLRETGIWRGEIENVKANGERFWCEADVSSYDDDEYGPVWVTVHRDITAHRHAEEALQASERRFHMVFDRSPVGLALIDQHLRITVTNRAFTTLLGRTPGELDGTPLAALTPEDDVTRDAALAADLFTDRTGEFSVEKLYLTASGRPLWVDVSGAIIPAVGEAGTDQVLLVVDDISERKAAEENLTFLATHDALTGADNRSTIVPAIQRALGRAERTGSWVGIAFADLDRFKQVNDVRGHSTGDECLRDVARALTRSIRPGDSLARVGGDEFAVCYEELGTDTGEAISAAAQLGRRMVAAVDAVGAETSLDVGCSVGIVLARGRDRSPSQLLAAADAAMYQVKRRGGGSVEVSVVGDDAHGSRSSDDQVKMI